MKNNRYYQKCITFGRAAEGLRADFQIQLKEIQSEIGFEYIRFHGLFHDDMAVYDEDENGNPILWFGYIDKRTVKIEFFSAILRCFNISIS